jgi:N-methylhydantoinase B/oxoprolinase/acetone carboxylase alpha subunit
MIDDRDAAIRSMTAMIEDRDAAIRSMTAKIEDRDAQIARMLDAGREQSIRVDASVNHDS